MSLLPFLLVIAAAFAHAAWNVIAHGASRSGLPFLWCASTVSTLLWLPALPSAGLGTDDLAGIALGVGVSAVLHVGYMLVLQRGYAVGSFSTVYATARGVGPMLTVAAAVLFLGERPSAAALIGVGVIILGVVAIGLIDRPRADRGVRRLDLGVVFGILTGIMIAAYTLWDAMVVRVWEVSPIAFMIGCTLLEVPLFTLALGRRLPAVVPILRTQWRQLLIFGVLSPLSYVLVLTAVTMAPVALVAPLREVSVVLVALYGAFVLREGSPKRRLAASIVVLGGIGMLAV